MAEEESPGRTLRGERIGNGSPKGSYLPLGLIAVLAAATGCTTRAAPAEGRVAPWLEDVRIEELKDTDGLDHTYLVTVPCTVELDGSEQPARLSADSVVRVGWSSVLRTSLRGRILDIVDAVVTVESRGRASHHETHTHLLVRPEKIGRYRADGVRRTPGSGRPTRVGHVDLAFAVHVFERARGLRVPARRCVRLVLAADGDLSVAWDCCVTPQGRDRPGRVTMPE